MKRLWDWLKNHLPSKEVFGGCRGLRIPFLFGYQLELWYAPGKGVIEPHVHETVDSHIYYLWGKVEAMVDGKYAIAYGPVRKRNSNGSWVLAHRHIPAGQIHGARILGKRGFFAVWQRCHEKYVSPSVDFVPKAL
jgi:hypothetical protein